MLRSSRVAFNPWLHFFLGISSLQRQDHLMEALEKFPFAAELMLHFSVRYTWCYASKSFHQNLLFRTVVNLRFSKFYIAFAFELQENGNKRNCFMLVLESFQLANDSATATCLVADISSAPFSSCSTVCWLQTRENLWIYLFSGGKSNPITIKPTPAYIKYFRTNRKQKHNILQPPAVITDMFCKFNS